VHFVTLLLDAFLFCLHSAVLQVSKGPRITLGALIKTAQVFVLIGNRPVPYWCISTRTLSVFQGQFWTFCGLVMAPRTSPEKIADMGIGISQPNKKNT